jgi:hypothetical protein
MHHTKRWPDGLVNPWCVAPLRRRRPLTRPRPREIAGDPLDFRLDKPYIRLLFRLVTSLRFGIPLAMGRAAELAIPWEKQKIVDETWVVSFQT